MLVLFDIDGTLLLSGGAGVKAFLTGLKEMFGVELADERRRFSGGLDPLIFRDLCRLGGIEHSPEHHERFRVRYAELLFQHLSPEGVVQRLPGAKELVAAVDAHERATLGLLTGNYPETGRFKIERAGLDPERFEIAAWGIDGDSRRALPRVAMERFVEKKRRTLPPEQVIIIGDTPNDVDCAKHNGCRVIGVATGLYSVAELEACGADLAVSNLADTQRLVEWMFS